MKEPLRRSIFRRGSRTYFYSSLFFPSEMREEVSTLYAFVRVADDYVDSIPQDHEGFHSFCDRFAREWEGEVSNDPVITPFVRLAHMRQFRREWIDSFLQAMSQDLVKSQYETLLEVEDYMYGSAEVIGLMMARIMGLDEASLHFARHLGKAMQYINFIRDIHEDQTLGRSYLPATDCRTFGVTSLSENDARSRPNEFSQLIRYQIDRYREWQRVAEEGFRFIPRRYLVPVKTASEMYKWTADTISKDPLLVFQRKVKPHISRILCSIGYHSITTPWTESAGTANNRALIAPRQ